MLEEGSLVSSSKSFAKSASVYLQVIYKLEKEKPGETEHFSQVIKINITNEGETDIMCFWI